MIFWKKQSVSSDQATPSEPKQGTTEQMGSDRSWLERLTKGLGQSSQKLTQGLVDLVSKRPLDQETLDHLEELLISADLGPQLAMRLVDEFKSTRFGKEVSDNEIKQALSLQIAAILHPVAKPLHLPDTLAPHVLLMVGINGSGKTTTIGKLSQQYASQGRKLILGAGDTFRAAAIEQLKIWGQRTGAQVVAKELGSDAAAVAFETLELAKQTNADLVMLDTAGRLHNKSNLMEELAKIRRVIQKSISDAPHLTILTLDATIGQNAITQVEEFNKVVPLSGLIVTKLDGSAKAGIVVALADRFKLPIFAVGVGETADDLHPFDAADFANALMGVAQS